MAAIIIFCIAFVIVLFIIVYNTVTDKKTEQLKSQLNFTDEDLKHITFHGVGGTRMDWNHLLSRPAVKKQVEEALKHYKENEEK